MIITLPARQIINATTEHITILISMIAMVHVLQEYLHWLAPLMSVGFTAKPFLLLGIKYPARMLLEALLT